MKERVDQFSSSEIKKITQRFSSFSEDDSMTLEQFKKSMGLLGVGQAEYISKRIFSLITDCSYCTCEEFIQFLDTINNGTHLEKVRLSFSYLDRQKTGLISHSDIEVIISEVSFVWNFLTGEKISTTDLTSIVGMKLGISQQRSISFEEYYDKYDKYFNWYDFFNNPIQPSRYHNDPTRPYTSIRNSSNQFKIEQIEQYLKLVHLEVQGLLYDFNQQNNTEGNSLRKTHNGGVKSATGNGPKIVTMQEFQPKGDYGLNFRETMPYLNQEQLANQLQKIDEEGNIIDKIGTKLGKLSQISAQLFSNKMLQQSVEQVREKAASRHQLLENQRKKTVRNMSRPIKKRRNVLYFGHENWNIMLNLMLGIRRSLKSHYYKLQQSVIFKEEDVTCKYQHDLIYKSNLQSIKEISQFFSTYSPKLFFYIRHYSRIDNYQLLKSIGLQNLIGNLLLGNLSTLSDQTSQGKSGSFMYYTDDSKIIVKSISRNQYLKLRGIIEDYAIYLRDHPETYLMRIYGLYKMKNKSSGRCIYFIIIGNLFDTQAEIDERYDIKGATYNRQLLPTSNGPRHKDIALKDLDLVQNNSRVFDIEPSAKEAIFHHILQDAQFLRDHNIIEYSLLIGIHYTNLNEVPVTKQINLFPNNKPQLREVWSKNRQEVYYFGIIDLLSQYTTARKLQSGFFSILNYDISCKDPQQYYQRFKNFIFKYVFGL